ncbi:unnamed protein product [Vitrella brassicaformis CCMP3155]|uniref:Enoyl reductase (ER) domain-containing protein n=1 Tax=Vitrella brassicaformis (strain CCMP3155) TaxID=1169540 RepID=A0A0G4FK39_VITBC|nr:unnamed protein product [Vitrella brassicaformis CCMP3155]|mmetsp:Transcript_36652/g.91814  ORF Transcript_36652/g.91814 Transcript_36652/m.91814 type:complete len:391 (-) Transcript_36652:490-1662(-)|eukprot:CEM14143.1 unnamed protein product [Vitrella brassicaformis CCMP3155]
MLSSVLREGGPLLGNLKRSMKLERLHIPKPRRGEVLLKTTSCGVCHTDLHVIQKEVPFPMPAVMGHEVCGELVDFGPSVSEQERIRLTSGGATHFVAPFIMPCGECHQCVEGQEDICDTFFAMNRVKGTLYDGETRYFTEASNEPIAMYSMGGLSQYTVVPVSSVFPLPPVSFPPHQAAILGCAIFTAYGAIKNAADLQVGQSVCVIGAAGGVGSNILQIARAYQCYPRIAVDVNDEKLAACRDVFGATHTINSRSFSSADEVRDAIRGVTDYGRGLDVSFEAIGKPATFELAINIVKDGGKAVMVGIADVKDKASVPITHVVRRKIMVHGSYGAKTRKDMPEILKLLANGSLEVSRFISREYTLEQSEEAYADLADGKIQGRAVVRMDG